MSPPVARISFVTTSPERLLGLSLLAVTLLKLILAFFFPLTGDEAYFFQWGQQLDGSYYDHGPITGWWIWLHLALGDHLAWLRLPAVLVTPLVALVLWRLLRPLDPAKAALAAALFAWSPVSVMSVLMTTDIPLLYFGVLAIAMAVRAHRTQRTRDYLFTGALLGLAFLSKYFAVLLGFALAVWWLFFSGRPRVSAVLWVLVGVLPFAAQHMYWNYHHSWVNVVFNLFTRQEEAGLSWHGPVLLLAVLAYLLAPFLPSLFRSRHRAAAGAFWTTLRTTPVGVAFAAFAVPHLVFLAVSLTRPIGVHWLLSFYPFAYVGLMLLFTRERLERLLRPMVVFGGVHILLGLLVCLIPLSWLRSHKSYASIVLGVYPEEVSHALAPYLPEYQLATPSYAKSALLDFYVEGSVPVLGLGSFHGRQDDLRTDLRTLDGRKVAVLSHRADQIAEAADWFDASEVHELHVRGARLKLLLGQGFRFDRYREQVLQRVAANYYLMPPWLERFSSGCYFRQRYDLPPLAR